MLQTWNVCNEYIKALLKSFLIAKSKAGCFQNAHLSVHYFRLTLGRRIRLKSFKSPFSQCSVYYPYKH